MEEEIFINKIIDLFGDMQYKENVPRVTSIVDFMYPFNNTDWEERYLDWLKSNNISEKEYLDWASELWSFVHKQAELFIKWEDIETYSNFYKNEVWLMVDNLINWLKDLSPEYIKSEIFVIDKNNLAQWTIDMVYKKDWKIIIADIKTYWVVKRRYWKNNKFSVDKKRREKVRLQMSIYAYLYNQYNIEKVEKIKLLFIHDEWVREYEMDVMTKKEIEIVLAKYYAISIKEETNLDININNMEVIIHEPTVQYWFIELRVDLDKVDNWKTTKDNIDDMIKMWAYLKQEYNKNITNK